MSILELQFGVLTLTNPIITILSLFCLHMLTEIRNQLNSPHPFFIHVKLFSNNNVDNSVSVLLPSILRVVAFKIYRKSVVLVSVRTSSIYFPFPCEKIISDSFKIKQNQLIETIIHCNIFTKYKWLNNGTEYFSINIDDRIISLFIINTDSFCWLTYLKKHMYNIGNNIQTVN